MRKHGLRVTHAMKETRNSLCWQRAQQYVTDALQLAKEKADRYRLRLYEVLRHCLGGDAVLANIWRWTATPVSLQNCMNEETLAGVVGWGKTLGCIASSITVKSAGAGAHSSRRRQTRRGAHGVPRRRGAWPDHSPRRGSVPAGRLFRQRQGDQQSLGRALVEARRQCDAKRAVRLHRSRRRRHASRATRSAGSRHG